MIPVTRQHQAGCPTAGRARSFSASAACQPPAPAVGGTPAAKASAGTSGYALPARQSACFPPAARAHRPGGPDSQRCRASVVPVTPATAALFVAGPLAAGGGGTCRHHLPLESLQEDAEVSAILPLPPFQGRVSAWCSGHFKDVGYSLDRTCPAQSLALGRSDLRELNSRPAPMTFSYRSWSAYVNSPVKDNETPRILRIPPDAVRQHLARARARLKMLPGSAGHGYPSACGDSQAAVGRGT